jgi:hypothetical protein
MLKTMFDRILAEAPYVNLGQNLWEKSVWNVWRPKYLTKPFRDKTRRDQIYLLTDVKNLKIIDKTSCQFIRLTITSTLLKWLRQIPFWGCNCNILWNCGPRQPVHRTELLPVSVIKIFAILNDLQLTTILLRSSGSSPKPFSFRYVGTIKGVVQYVRTWRRQQAAGSRQQAAASTA